MIRVSYEVLKRIRDGGNVERFHTSRMISRQNVAEHSYNASLLGFHIANNVVKYSILNKEDATNVNPEKVAMFMLLHDISEQGTGDVPSFVKNKYLSMKNILDKIELEWAKDNLPDTFINYYDRDNLSSRERIICKFSDQYECAMTCKEEYEMGNTNFLVIFNRCVESLRILVNSLDDTVLEDVLSEFIDHLLSKKD